ncbi:MAG: T9SS type A sorting domain-containing protein [bacterium]|nr:T9SS type A sorting domain-containing protein [bacterium]
MLRRILRDGALPLFGLAAMVIGLLALPTGPTAQACWRSELIECFDQAPLPTCNGGWPFISPRFTSRSWRHSPTSGNRWGFQLDYFDLHMCADDQQALWCMGCPASNDPEFDNYVAGLNTYVVWGPISLAQAEAAAVNFYFYNRSEANGDSLYWGAATTYNLTSASTMNVAGSYSGIMLSDWESRTMNLDSLRNLGSGNWVSMLGQSTVYIFWRFQANGNSVVDLGAFIDNITVMWDDGGVDLRKGAVTLHNLDSSDVLFPRLDSTVFATFDWSTCSGGSGVYPPFRITGTLDDTVILDTVMTDVGPGESHTFYTSPWVMSTPDSHLVRFVLDTLDEVDETDETNNVGMLYYYIEPPNHLPDFVWIAPGPDGPLYADTTAILRWECYDPDEEAQLWFYSDNDTVGCLGALIPGGSRPEIDGPDSLVWNTSGQPDGRTYRPFVLIFDAANDTCIYALNPLIIHHGGAAGNPVEGLIPDAYYLLQNYPNPFNPRTEIRYGVAVGGEVTVTVYDLLGRAVTTLADGFHAPGSYRVEMDGTKLASGVYLYTLTSPEGSITRKMMLMK